MELFNILGRLKFYSLFSISDSSRDNGFTLLEILIALAIVGGLLVTVIASLNYHLGIVERHETITVATPILWE